MTLNDALASFKEFVKKLTSNVNKGAENKEFGAFTGPVILFGNIQLTGELAEEFMVLSNNVCEAACGRESLSRSAAEVLLQKSISAAINAINTSPLEIEPRLSEEANRLRQALQAAPSEWDIHVPIVGFAANNLPMQFGRIVFSFADEASIKARLAIALDGQPNDAKERSQDIFWESGARELSGHVVGVVSATAIDVEAAKALAVREVRRTLDVINYFASLSHPLESKAAFPWESYGSATVFLQFKKGGDLPGGVSVNWEQKGAIIPISLPRLQVHPGFLRVSNILTKVSPDGIEGRLLSAIQWAGRAAVEERKDQRFLFFMISLENLLLGSRKDSEIGYRFRVRGAHLLGSNLENRRQIQDLLKRLYGLRSKIVHSGSGQVTDGDLSMVQHFCKHALWRVLTGIEFTSITTDEGLEAWFDEKVLQ